MIFAYAFNSKGDLTVGVTVDYSHDGKDFTVNVNLLFVSILVGFGWGE